MAFVHFEENISRNRTRLRKAPPDVGAARRRSRVKRRAVWILPAALLAAAGLIAFQFLVTLVTLD